jgi:hypothetical protein
LNRHKINPVQIVKFFHQSKSPELWPAVLQTEIQLINPGKGCEIKEPFRIYT